MKSAVSSFFYDKPLFGLDIGHGSLKVMQIAEQSAQDRSKGKPPEVVGYGTASFDKTALDNGVLVQPEVIAQATLNLFQHHLMGDITTRRVALTIPAYRTFTRSVQLPALKPQQIRQAVELEAEQYISAPLEDLYLDYEVVRQTADGTEVLAVAVPRAIVDSYLELAQILGLETILIEPTLSASSRLFTLDEQSDVATVIIDFGALSCDISIYDKHVLVTGTVQGGGEDFTNSIKDTLGVSMQEAGLIKTRYGLGASKKQKEIQAAIEPTLQQMVKEVRRMMRYYEERYDADRPLAQVITLGGGANMPGLSEYLTDALRLAVRQIDPWQYTNHRGLQLPGDADKPMYATVAGLCLAPARKVFSHD